MFFIGEFKIDGNVKVQITIFIHIEKTGPCPHLKAVVHTCFFCHVCKGTVAIIAVQNIRAVIIEVNIRVPVIVVITDRNAQAVTTIADACFFRHIGKLPVTLIAVKCIFRSDVNFSSFQRRAIEKIDVDVPVAVVVKKRQTRTYRLHYVVQAGAAICVHEIYAGLVCNVAKQYGAIGERID